MDEDWQQDWKNQVTNYGNVSGIFFPCYFNVNATKYFKNKAILIGTDFWCFGL